MNKRALNLPILISLVIGNMIGTGIYVLPASLAGYGTISLLAWLYTSLGAILLALTFAHLNRRFPKTGGPYVYCKEAFGKLTGFIVAYTYWSSNLVSIAGITVASVGYLGFLSPTFDANTSSYNPTTVLLVELGIVWLFTLINIIGIHTAGAVQLLLTIVKILPLLAVTLIGVSRIHFQNYTQVTVGLESPFLAISSAATLTFWAFIGLESATIPAENTRGYQDIYKATVFGTLITALIYMSSTIVLMGIIPPIKLQHSQFPFAEAGTILFGAYAATLIAICAFISGLGALNACVLIQGQMVFAAARDHLFPKIFAKLSKKDAPIAGQLLSSTVVTLFLILTIEPTLLKQFNNIALLAALLTLITYFITTLAEIKFLSMYKQPLHHILLSKAFIITLLASAYAIWMISSFNHQILISAIALLGICIPIYFLTVRKYAEPSV